jgi:hypothetical protein
MITFMNMRTIRELRSQFSNPSRAFFDSLRSTIKSGIMIGKLKMAIRVKLLLVFEAIADTIVSKEENPKLPSISVNMKSGVSWIRLPTKRQ